jgi:hypothetical protein
MHRLVVTLGAAALLAACTQTAAPPPAPAASVSGVTPSTFALPSGSGCSGEVARYRAVMDNDLATGHVGKSIHAKVLGEIDEAAATCTAGRDAEAVRMIAPPRRATATAEALSAGAPARRRRQPHTACRKWKISGHRAQERAV